MKEHGKAIQSAKPQDYGRLKRKTNSSNKELVAEELLKNLKDIKISSPKDNLIKEYELKNVKYRIAVETGIPLALADRLSGKSEEEIKKDAESLASFINQKSKLPLKTTETKLTDPKEQAYAKMLENL